jgi:hypothetical protein
MTEPLQKIFPPALLGRLVVIPYYPLSDEMLGQIVRLQLNRIKRRVAENHKIPFDYSDDAVKLIVRRCNNAESGGRIIDSILTNTVHPPPRRAAPAILGWFGASRQARSLGRRRRLCDDRANVGVGGPGHAEQELAARSRFGEGACKVMEIKTGSGVISSCSAGRQRKLGRRSTASAVGELNMSASRRTSISTRCSAPRPRSR